MKKGIMAEFTVRVEREGDKATVQLVVHGTEIVAESEPTTITLQGNELYDRLFEDTLTAIKPRLMVAVKAETA